jgi:hypothetical protein
MTQTSAHFWPSSPSESKPSIEKIVLHPNPVAGNQNALMSKQPFFALDAAAITSE